VLDFFDTLFIVARGHWAQFSFLHVYHHFSIFLTYWLVTNAGADGDVFYTIVANSLVHLVMYSYYGLTTFNVRPPWGWLVTKVQMFQFITMNAQAFYILVNGCAYPRNLTAFYLVYIISLFILFQQFDSQRWAGGDKAKGKGAPRSKGD
jgi:elongation of very long chain fatty acids protein 4